MRNNKISAWKLVINIKKDLLKLECKVKNAIKNTLKQGVKNQDLDDIDPDLNELYNILNSVQESYSRLSWTENSFLAWKNKDSLPVFLTLSYIKKVLLINKSWFKSFGFKAVGIFGSYARGDATPESDINILLIADEHDNNGRKIQNEDPMFWGEHSLRKLLYEKLNTTKITFAIKGLLDPKFLENILQEVTFILYLSDEPMNKQIIEAYGKEIATPASRVDPRA